MASPNLVRVGQDRNSTYVAYGDDCQFGDICGFAFLVVKRTRIKRVLRELEAIKARYGFPTGVPVHCRVLFSGDQRKKAGLSHLTKVQVEEIITCCILLLNDAGACVVFTHCRLSEFASVMGSKISLWDQAQADRVELNVHADPKGLIGFLSQLCLMVPATERRFARPHEWAIVVSQDKTQAKLFGDRSRQAHRQVTGFSEVGAAAGELFQYEPSIGTEATHPLLQLADVVVYALCHAQDEGERGRFWRGLPKIRLLHHPRFQPISPMPQATDVVPATEAT